jgi:hypothetical protein
MRKWTSEAYVPMLLLGLSVLVGAGCAAMGFRDKDYHPVIDPANFQATVDHPFFPLVPGTTYLYTETAEGKTSENIVEVTKDKKIILGVTCVVVHDIVKEDTWDWYTQDKQGNVWYFGEATKEFLDGGKVSTEGSWEAGVDGAYPGILLPGQQVVGSPPYRQEYYFGHAEDMGQIAALNESVTVPYGTFTGCLRTEEWSLLEVGSEKKWYAKGVGFVRSESTKGDVSVLVSVTKP